jgi:hypothetical protein
MGDHVGDHPLSVATNRAKLIEVLNLPSPPRWLHQTHSTTVLSANDWSEGIEADAIYTRSPQTVCAIMTADCLPVLICDAQGVEVAAIHAGWRGLCHGIIEKTVAQFTAPAQQLSVWLGPAIGPTQFEVEEDVVSAFVEQDEQAKQAFIQIDATHFLADIYLLARQRLTQLGILQIYGGENCTVSDPTRFFSYRRDGVTGRMATLIWLDPK